nr:type I-C CRISPR-associated protein Cas8c/Csd1 [Cohnella sp. REN36]
MLNLYETYESHLDQIGKIEKKRNEQEYTLLPISHTTQTAHIEVRITEDGEFHSANVIEKGNAITLIPCTEDSASRAGAVVAPYPLHDKISYVAGDFAAYGGQVKKEEPFQAYISNLRAWAESPYAVNQIKSIYRYLSKGHLIQDLVAERVLHVDENNRLIEKWDKPDIKPPIFSVMVGGPESLFVRFNVYSPKLYAEVWKDPAVYESFIRYYREELREDDLCYVTGEMRPSTDKHANKIRNAADKAKLISANDKSGFTYRGRFADSREAANISYEVSQKAHNALKWLINRQGKIIDQRVFLVWGNEDPDIPSLADDPFAIPEAAGPAKDTAAYTAKEYALEVSKALDGYRNRLSRASKENVNILVLDSATTGRMAVLYYRNMDKRLYLDRLVKWHTTCAWLHRYHTAAEGDRFHFYGAPATKDIAFASYGPRAGDKVVKGLMERMLPCILDEQREIPRDIVSSACQRASNPIGMERWEWEKTLSITCALVNHQYKGGYQVALDYDNHDRDYLFGRLLAVADVLERVALEENRSTNAIRYMNAFSRHPARTWGTIQASLQPYQARLGAKATYWNKIIDEIGSKIPIDQFNNRPLSGVYLLGFYSQRHELYQKKQKQEQEPSE